MNDEYFIPLFVSCTLLLVLFVFFLIAYLLIQKKKQNTYQLEKSKMIYNHQNKILIARFEEQERTMDQMSKEIHDNIGQLLNFTKMNMFVIAKHATKQEQIILIEKTKNILDMLIQDVHNISHSLNSDFIKQKGLVAVLQGELDSLNISDNIDCRIEVKGVKRTLNPDKELLIYRIAQEAIHNISKHSRATEFSVVLTYEHDTFSMCIADNGIGFDKNKIYELNGIGFLNMFQRAKLLKGSLDIHAEPTAGCMITLHLDNASDMMDKQGF